MLIAHTLRQRLHAISRVRFLQNGTLMHLMRLISLVNVVVRNILDPGWVVFDLLTNQNITLLLALLQGEIAAVFHEGAARFGLDLCELFVVVVASWPGVD